MEEIYDSYVSDVYPDEDGKYSVVKITKGTNENTDKAISIYPNTDKRNTLISHYKELKVIFKLKYLI